MEKEQAALAAKAVMEPALLEQHARSDRDRAMHASSHRHLRRGRIALVFMAAGAAAGSATAFWTGQQFSHGLWWGLIIGGVIGWAAAYAKVRAA